MDDPWFVRSRRQGKYVINPVSRGGWFLTLGFLVLIFLSSSAMAVLPAPIGLICFVVLTLVGAAGFVTIAWRTSVPEAEWRRRKR